MITLTNAIQNERVLISDCDKNFLSKWNWTKDNSHDYFYRQKIDNDKVQHKTYLHRLVAQLKYKRKLKDNECVDHADGNKYNNTRENIRIVTYKQNRINNNPLSSRTNTGFTGIYENKDNSFTVKVGKKTVGKYDSIEEALYARLEYIYSTYKIDIYERVRTAAATKEIYI